MTDLLFREWVVQSAQHQPIKASDLCSVHLEPSPLFVQAAREYRESRPPLPINKQRKEVAADSAATNFASSIAITSTPAVEATREKLRAAHCGEFDNGFRVGALGSANACGTCIPGGYPKGFFEWSQAARNAWFAGHYAGLASAKKLMGGAHG